MSTLGLNALLESVAKGDALALGELPNALVGKSSAEIDQAGKALRPLLLDTGLMTATETIIMEAYASARKRERLDAMMPPGFTDPVERKRNWNEQPGEPLMSSLILKGMDEMASLVRMMRGVSVKNPHLGEHAGEYRVERPVITEPQKGQQPYTIDGVEVYAGSYKAAVKKVRKLKAMAQ